MDNIETSEMIEMDLGFESQSPQTMSNPVNMMNRNGNRPQFRQDYQLCREFLLTKGFNGNRQSPNVYFSKNGYNLQSQLEVYFWLYQLTADVF